MTQVLEKYTASFQAMNSRVKVGGGVLSLVLAGQGLMAYFAPIG